MSEMRQARARQILYGVRHAEAADQRRLDLSEMRPRQHGEILHGVRRTEAASRHGVSEMRVGGSEPRTASEILSRMRERVLMKSA